MLGGNCVQHATANAQARRHIDNSELVAPSGSLWANMLRFRTIYARPTTTSLPTVHSRVVDIGQ